MNESEKPSQPADRLNPELLEGSKKQFGLDERQAIVFVRLMFQGDLSMPEALTKALSQYGIYNEDRGRIISDWLKENPDYVDQQAGGD